MKRTFGGILADVLLILYVYAVWIAVRVAQCMSQHGCTSYTKDSLTDGVVAVLTGVGALVSALVVAELALTPPGDASKARVVQSDVSHATQTELKFAKWNSLIYLVVWALVGLVAFIVGVMQHGKLVQPLTDIGMAWLGLAVTAVYSYFEVRP